MPSFFKNITIDDVGYVKLPVGDTSQRPGNTQNGQMRFNSDRGIPEFRDNAQTEWKRQNQPGQVVATGGDAVYDIEQFGRRYRVHVFTQNGTISVSKGGEVEYLIVAGGGGGGAEVGGGGGAGGLLTGTTSVTAQTYTVTVGSGGADKNVNQGVGNNGNNSVFSSLAAIGGGGGGAYPSQAGLDGGSGGGGGVDTSGTGGAAGGNGVSGQGNNGGSNPGTTHGSSCGGGGAGAAGEDAGPGGIGILSSITGSSSFYAGGGGGGDGFFGTTDDGPHRGGLGGGGTGANNIPIEATRGVPNTGGGGGGGSGGGGGTPARYGRAGGSGIVVARYEIRDEEQLTPADKDITEGLVLDLDFAKPTVYNGTGSTVSDSRLFPIEGSVNGASYVNARTHRSAFDFDGVDDVIDFQDFSVSNFISVAMWFKSTDTETSVSLLDINTTGNDGGFSIVFRSGEGDGRLSVVWRDDLFTSGGYPFSTGTSDVRDGVWHHAVGIYNGSEVQIYIDGTREINLSRSSQLTQVAGQFLRLGGLGNQSSGFRLAAEIGYCRIYDRGLSEQEVQTLYNLTRWRFGV